MRCAVIIGLFVVCFSAFLNLLSRDMSALAKELALEKSLNAEYINEIQVLSDEIVLRQDLTSLIIDAARAYKLDPMLLAKVIKSEGNFRPDPRHALPWVIGPAGINVKAHKNLKHNPYSYVGNIYASAEILSDYINDSDSLLLAVTRYKGLSPLGLAQAKEVVKQYNMGLKESQYEKR